MIDLKNYVPEHPEFKLPKNNLRQELFVGGPSHDLTGLKSLSSSEKIL